MLQDAQGECVRNREVIVSVGGKNETVGLNAQRTIGKEKLSSVESIGGKHKNTGMFRFRRQEVLQTGDQYIPGGMEVKEHHCREDSCQEKMEDWAVDEEQKNSGKGR